MSVIARVRISGGYFTLQSFFTLQLSLSPGTGSFTTVSSRYCRQPRKTLSLVSVIARVRISGVILQYGLWEILVVRVRIKEEFADRKLTILNLFSFRGQWIHFYMV